MIEGNIPSSKKDAEIYLGAYKQALLDIAAKVSSQEIGTNSDADMYIWSTIEKVERMMESGDYEES